jgi:hypothetical protein
VADEIVLVDAQPDHVIADRNILPLVDSMDDEVYLANLLIIAAGNCQSSLAFEYDLAQFIDIKKRKFDIQR